MFGILLTLFLVYVFLFGPDTLPLHKQRILALLGASLAGFFTFFFTGSVGVKEAKVRFPFGEFEFRAAGGVAVFFIVIAWWTSEQAPIRAAPTAPSPASPDSSFNRLPPTRPSPPVSPPAPDAPRADAGRDSAGRLQPAPSSLKNARLLLQENNYGAAYDSFVRARAALPHHVRDGLDDALIQQADSAARRGEFPLAAQLYADAMQSIPPT